MIQVALGVSTYGRLWHQVGTNYLTGVCTRRGDLLIPYQDTSRKPLLFQHLFVVVPRW